MSKVILITGTRKGLGRALAEHYLAAGWTVVGCSRKEAVLEHGNYTHHKLDVSVEPAVATMVRDSVKKHGRLDALICNAGTASMNHFATTPLSTAKSLLETNVLGTFVVMREAAKAIRKSGGGRIVTVSSIAAPLALEGEALYAASKSAVETLTRTAARELSAWGITVNAVGPGPIKTDLIKGVPAESIDELMGRQAIKRLGTPADVCNVVDFFLQPDSEFVTGQVVYLGGPYG